MGKSGRNARWQQRLLLKTRVYTEFCRNDPSNLSDDLSDDEKKALKTLYEQAPSLYFDDVCGKSKTTYSLISVADYHTFCRTKKESEPTKRDLIYRVEKNNDRYWLVAGKYCGVITLPAPDHGSMIQLEIGCGFSNRFLRRLLDFCCGIYVNDSPTDGSETERSMYTLLVQYVFLTALRRAINRGLPKKYVIKQKRGYGVEGNVDVESYVNFDLTAFDKKITSVYGERTEIQSIIDVLYAALTCCSAKDGMLPDLHECRNYLHGRYSGVKPDERTIRRALSEPILNSSLYSVYRLPLVYAELLIKHSNIGLGNDGGQASDFLVDASLLWEMYLGKLLERHFREWKIDMQSRITVYGETFYKKSNYPDIVMTHKDTGRIVILDAKFKTMNFQGEDVDMEDLRQIHFYANYYSVKYPGKLIGAGLVYPTKCEAGSNRTISPLFGVPDQKIQFGIFTIRDCQSAGSAMKDSEDTFINDIKAFIGGVP